MLCIPVTWHTTSSCLKVVFSSHHDKQAAVIQLLQSWDVTGNRLKFHQAKQPWAICTACALFPVTDSSDHCWGARGLNVTVTSNISSLLFFTLVVFILMSFLYRCCGERLHSANLWSFSGKEVRGLLLPWSWNQWAAFSVILNGTDAIKRPTIMVRMLPDSSLQYGENNLCCSVLWRDMFMFM